MVWIMKRCRKDCSVRVLIRAWLSLAAALWFAPVIEREIRAGTPDPGASSGTSKWLVKTWMTDDGLPGSDVTGIVQTAAGYLWLGTFDGLVRFDGLKFTVFDR